MLNARNNVARPGHHVRAAAGHCALLPALTPDPPLNLGSVLRDTLSAADYSLGRLGAAPTAIQQVGEPLVYFPQPAWKAQAILCDRAGDWPPGGPCTALEGRHT